MLIKSYSNGIFSDFEIKKHYLFLPDFKFCFSDNKSRLISIYIKMNQSIVDRFIRFKNKC